MTFHYIDAACVIAACTPCPAIKKTSVLLGDNGARDHSIPRWCWKNDKSIHELERLHQHQWFAIDLPAWWTQSLIPQ